MVRLTMILVTAATGQYGRLVVDALLQKVTARNVAVAVRDPDKAGAWRERGVDVRRGDYDDLSSLRSALAGADEVLFISSPEFDLSKRMAQHERMIEAAKQASVRHIAYTSFLGAQVEQPGGFNAHYLTERALERSGMTSTFLRHPFYTEALVNPPLLKEAIDSGELKDATGGKAVNTASRADLAAAAAAFLSGSAERGKPYELAGRPWTFTELAQAISRAGGRPVAARAVETADMGQRGWLFDLIRAGLYERAAPDLERLLGRAATSLDLFVAGLVRTALTA